MSLMESLGIDRWSVEDRRRLLDEISESLAVDAEGVELSETHKEDLRRRLDAYRDDPKAGEPWEVVRDRLMGNAG
jgi:putative addiction module component (TIGR02574 family)